MDFKRSVLFYINCYSKLRKPKTFFLYLQYRYELVKINKQRMKMGEVRFAFKRLYFDDLIIDETFEMEYKSQVAEKPNKEIKKTLTQLDLKKDFQTFSLVSLLILLLMNYGYIHLSDFLETNVWSLYSTEQARLSVDYIFTNLIMTPTSLPALKTFLFQMLACSDSLANLLFVLFRLFTLGLGERGERGGGLI